MKKLNVGLIGYGFMGRAHSNAYRQVNKFFDLNHQPVLKVICGRNEKKVGEFAAQWEFESIETDWRRVVENKNIDIVDIATPNNTHHDIALAAAESGKMVLCEKPLAMNAQEGEAMVEAVEKAGVANMVWFNYRRVPAIALAKQIVDQGKMGKIFHYRALYLQDWTINPKLPQGGPGLWRLDVDAAGSGVTGDLLAHSIDTAMWLIGGISSVSAMTETFVKERELHEKPGIMKPVAIDDACAFLARFQNGALGTFESSRYSRGRKNYYTLEINGEQGALYFDMENAHQLGYFNHNDESVVRGWRTIQVWDSDHPYMKNWWVPGCTIGYEHTFINTLADFLKDLEQDQKFQPDFKVALATQHVCDVVLQSARETIWQPVSYDM